jgi:hypothetical protein
VALAGGSVKRSNCADWYQNLANTPIFFRFSLISFAVCGRFRYNHINLVFFLFIPALQVRFPLRQGFAQS